MILFSTLTCPKCNILKKKMENVNLVFTIEYDLTEISSLGFSSVPILKLDNGTYLEFFEANTFINSLEEKNGANI